MKKIKSDDKYNIRADCKISRKNRYIKIPKYKYFISTIISLFILILPLISRLKIMIISGEMKNIFTNSNGFYIDLFLYYKSIFIIVFSIFLILFFIGEIIFPDYKISYPLQDKSNKKIILCVVIYSITVILSYLFSKYKSLSLMGSPTECEGVFVLLGYMILLLAGINYFNYEKSINILRKLMIIFISIIVVLTFVEFLYKPLFEIPFLQKLLASKEYSELLGSIKNKDYQGMVSLTLYNPNYFGGLCVILFPIIFNLFINEKKKITKIYLSILSTGMIFCTIASKSTASIYIMLIQLLFILIYYREKIINNVRNTVIYVIGAMSIFIIINIVSNNKFIEVATKGFKNSPSIVNTRDKFTLKDINMNKNILEIKGEDETLIIELNNDDKESVLNFYNKDRVKITPIINDNVYEFDSNEFKPITVEYLEYGIVVDIGYNDTMSFYITDEGFKGVGQNGIQIDNIKRENVILPELYSIATGRGYAWVNTIPLLKDTILWGTGPGTFAMYFQQNDYVGLMNTHGSAKFVIDKPHSMYLQIAEQTGILGLIALIIIFVIAIYKSINTYYKNKEEVHIKEFSLGLGIFIGIVGFLILALVNDSIVTVNPVFWILLGVNFSIINYLKCEGMKM